MIDNTTKVLFAKNVNLKKEDLPLPESKSDEPYRICLRNADNKDGFDDDVSIFFRFKDEFYDA